MIKDPSYTQGENLIADNLMTAEEYAVRAEELPAPPYGFEITTGGKSIRYLGLDHTFEAGDAALAELETQFQLSPPSSVFVEGVGAVGKYEREEIFTYLRTMSRDEVIQRHGEPMFTLWLAAQFETPENPIAIYSPEPPFQDEISAMESTGFSREDILSYHIFRTVPQYLAEGGAPEPDTFLDYIRPTLASFARCPGWDDALMLGEDIAEQIDLFDPEKYSNLSDPIPWEGKSLGPTNAVAKQTSRMRDEYIVSEIVKNCGANALVVYGYSHAVMQEPALRKAFQGG